MLPACGPAGERGPVRRTPPRGRTRAPTGPRHAAPQATARPDRAAPRRPTGRRTPRRPAAASPRTAAPPARPDPRARSHERAPDHPGLWPLTPPRTRPPHAPAVRRPAPRRPSAQRHRRPPRRTPARASRRRWRRRPAPRPPRRTTPATGIPTSPPPARTTRAAHIWLRGVRATSSSALGEPRPAATRSDAGPWGLSGLAPPRGDVTENQFPGVSIAAKNPRPSLENSF